MNMNYFQKLNNVTYTIIVHLTVDEMIYYNTPYC